MQRLIRFLVGGIISLGVAVPVVTATTSEAGASSANLVLSTPWTAAPFGTNAPSVSLSRGVVSLRGAIAAPSGNTNDEPFFLPPAYRPAGYVDVPVDVCGVTTGELVIESNGASILQLADGSLSDANCFVSLDGVSFVKSSPVTPLALINGWVSSNQGTANPAVTLVNGVVHFQGALSNTSSSSNEPFVLPANLAPSAPVFVPVDMCGDSSGRLEIATDGSVTLHEEDQGTIYEDCFTSLDGASFVLHSKNSTALTLKNGWANQAYGTAPATAELVKGVVRLQGGISSGASSVITTLPATMRPTKNVFVTVDLWNAAMGGRLEIQPSGKVSIQESDEGLIIAQGFTSLDGASFVK
jgi:hypothetical protein